MAAGCLFSASVAMAVECAEGEGEGVSDLQNAWTTARGSEPAQRPTASASIGPAVAAPPHRTFQDSRARRPQRTAMHLAAARRQGAAAAVMDGRWGLMSSYAPSPWRSRVRNGSPPRTAKGGPATKHVRFGPPRLAICKEMRGRSHALGVGQLPRRSVTSELRVTRFHQRCGCFCDRSTFLRSPTIQARPADVQHLPHPPSTGMRSAAARRHRTRLEGLSSAALGTRIPWPSTSNKPDSRWRRTDAATTNRRVIGCRRCRGRGAARWQLRKPCVNKSVPACCPMSLQVIARSEGSETDASSKAHVSTAQKADYCLRSRAPCTGSPLMRVRLGRCVLPAGPFARDIVV